MTTDYYAELQRLVKAYDDHGGKWPEGDVEALFQAVERARAYLDQPELEGLTYEELLAIAIESELVASNGTNPFREDSDIEDEVMQFARTVIAADRARWGRPATTTETP